MKKLPRPLAQLFWLVAIIPGTFVLGILALPIIFHTRWEVTLHYHESRLAMTFREKPGKQARTFVLENVAANAAPHRSYLLPDEASQIPDATLDFHDITFRPGRVTLTFHGHQFDVMEGAIRADGREFPWSNSTPILLPVASPGSNSSSNSEIPAAASK